MGKLPAAGSLPPGPRGVYALSGTCWRVAESERPRAPGSCPRRLCRNRRDLAPQRIEAAPQPPCRDFCFLEHVLVRACAEGTWKPEDSDRTDPRNGLREQFQTLADELRGEVGQPRDIAARPREAGDEPAPNRIANNSEDNGDRPSRLLGHTGGKCAWGGHDDIHLERNQFGRK